ncbi:MULTISPECIES: class F sortase [Streptomyces]|uniref:Class F sortase n=3 Tax=Streptomyces TaxID=1883 RepID=A0ABD5E468_9ACTN|nr:MULTISPECIES: class F sortase [unclassified Streptomyces]ASY31682.1 class F sortase [Streptomyces sp. CLI2509]MDT0416226.1 class F sortase [Streptomyces sp. DSM 41982]
MEAQAGRGKVRGRAPWGALALVLLAGIALLRDGSGEHVSAPPQPARAAAPDSASPATGGTRGLGFSRPRRVRVADIRVDAPVRPVGLDAQGWVQAPPPGARNLVGWFTGSVSPGERGPAVLVGHVDNKEGPAVFYGLGALRKGRHIAVERADGRTALFEVYGVEVFAQDDFPGERVYGPTAGPELRVITCGGAYHRGTGYDGNVVVFARMVGSAR